MLLQFCLIDDINELDKACVYAVSDIFAMPSQVDSFGIVYLEAWAHKKPVIACRHNPQETFIDDGRDGRLIHYDDHEELAEVILEMLCNNEKRKLMGENGFKKVQEIYHWDRVVDQIYGVYKNLVNAKIAVH